MTSCATSEYAYFAEISEQAEAEIEDGQILSKRDVNDAQEYLFVSFNKEISGSMNLDFQLQFAYERIAKAEHMPAAYRYWLKSITIFNENGELIQVIQGLDPVFLHEIPLVDFSSWWMMPSKEYIYGIGFADFNFDGFLDFSLPRHGTFGYVFGNFFHFLWDDETGRFVLNKQLIELEDGGFWQAEDSFRTYVEQLDGGNSHMWFDNESQLLVFESALSGSWFYFPPMERSIPSQYIIQYYQYVDGKFTLLRIQEMLYDWYGMWRVRDLDTETGIETITYIESEN